MSTSLADQSARTLFLLPSLTLPISHPPLLLKISLRFSLSPISLPSHRPLFPLFSSLPVCVCVCTLCVFVFAFLMCILHQSSEYESLVDQRRRWWRFLYSRCL